MELITAQEAKGLSKKITLSDTTKLAFISNCIQSAIRKGDSFAIVTFYASENICNTLNEYGYKVTKGSDRNEDFTKIEW